MRPVTGFGWQTPWELFDEADARQALGSADSSVTLAKQLVTLST